MVSQMATLFILTYMWTCNKTQKWQIFGSSLNQQAFWFWKQDLCLDIKTQNAVDNMR